tara:strand:- start:4429 stop:4650 length:222 start_codon:yes stop_codon:yes gene_type:complete
MIEGVALALCTAMRGTLLKEHIIVAPEASRVCLACHYSGVLDIAWCEFEAGLGPTRGQDLRLVRGVTCDYSIM